MLKERNGKVLMMAKCYCMLDDAGKGSQHSANIMQVEPKGGSYGSVNDCDPTRSYPLHPRTAEKGYQTSARLLLVHQRCPARLGTTRSTYS